MRLEDKYRDMMEEEREEEQQKQDQQKREPRRSPQTAGERARAERDLRMGAHPVQGEQENDAYKA